jgi:hypothetical protein
MTAAVETPGAQDPRNQRIARRSESVPATPRRWRRPVPDRGHSSEARYGVRMVGQDFTLPDRKDPPRGFTPR